MKICIIVMLIKLQVMSTQGSSKGNNTTTIGTTLDVRPFYPDPFFSIKEPNMEKYFTSHYGDYRYFDVNAKYNDYKNSDWSSGDIQVHYDETDDEDEEEIGFHVNPSLIPAEKFYKNKKTKEEKIKRLWAHFKSYYGRKYPNYWAEDFRYNIFKKNLETLRELEFLSNYNGEGTRYRINKYTDKGLNEFIYDYAGIDGKAFDNETKKFRTYINYTEYKDEVNITNLDYSFNPTDGHKIEAYDEEGENIAWLISAVNVYQLQILNKFSKTEKYAPRVSLQQAFLCTVPKPYKKQASTPDNVLNGFKQNAISLHPSDKTGQPLTHWGWCQPSQSNSKPYYVSGLTHIIIHDEKGLKHALINFGPIVTTISITERLKSYHSGVISEKYCAKDLNRRIAHPVVIVGFGEHKQRPYWKVLNSWGSDWGEMGFFKIVRSPESVLFPCGIAEHYVMTPTITDNKDDLYTTQPPVTEESENTTDITESTG